MALDLLLLLLEEAEDGVDEAVGGAEEEGDAEVLAVVGVQGREVEEDLQNVRDLLKSKGIFLSVRKSGAC